MGGARITQGERVINIGSVKAGQKVFRTINFIVDSVTAGITIVVMNGRELDYHHGERYDIVDEEGTLWSLTGYLARNNERNFKKIEYRYDPDEPLPLDQQNIQPGMITDEKAKATRAAIEEIRKTKGEISDYEAIELLHNRIELFIRTGIEGQEAIDILWQAREMTRQKGGDYWKNVEKIAKGRGTKFFRYGNFNNGLNSFGHGNDAC